MKRSFREKLIAVVTFIAGLYFFLEFVLPKHIGEFQFGRYHDQISNGFIVVGTMAIGLGLINLLLVHGGAILKTRKGWPYSVALLAGLGLMMGFEIAAFVQSEQAVKGWQEIAQLRTYYELVQNEADTKDPQPRLQAAQVRLDQLIERTAQPGDVLYVADSMRRVTLVESLREVQQYFVEAQAGAAINVEDLRLAVGMARTLAKETSDERLENSFAKQGASFLYNGFFVPLGAAMFSLLAFYVASAAYRTFRIRSAEAGIMMFAALIVMLGQIPHGPLYISPKLVPIRLWLLEQLSTPAFRAIFFGAAIAGLAMAVRMWLSLERSPLETEE